MSHPALSAATQLSQGVLAPMKAAFVGKDEIIDLLGICLVGRENLFLMGPPGTAKSALVQDLASRIHGRSFDYLLTRFTEPNELFGPFDIRKLREGELVTNTQGMLPEADLVFLDELLNANSAVLNSLLLALNERVFRRGREKFDIPMLMAVGASNHLPDDEALAALFDRFLLRVPCRNVEQEQLPNVLHAGWELERQARAPRNPSLSVEQVRQLQDYAWTVDVSPIRTGYVELVQRLRHAGVAISDRRAVKLQRLLAASAVVCGRTAVNASDLWILRHTWETEEQQQVLAELVGAAIQRLGGNEAESPHPRVRADAAPDPEAVARDVERIESRLSAPLAAADRSYVRDQISVLVARCEWIAAEQPRQFLHSRLKALRERVEGEA